MLKGLKVSALAQKWVFYRSEVIGNGGPHRTEVLSFGNAKIYQPIELKDEMKKKFIHSSHSSRYFYLFQDLQNLIPWSLRFALCSGL